MERGIHRSHFKISTYINTKMSVCVFVCAYTFFLGHFETGWDTLWHKLSFYAWRGNIKIYVKAALIN